MCAEPNHACEQALCGERIKEEKENCCSHTGSAFRSTGSKKTAKTPRQKNIINGKSEACKIKYVNRKAIAVGKGFTIPKTISDYKRRKIYNFLRLFVKCNLQNRRKFLRITGVKCR